MIPRAQHLCLFNSVSLSFLQCLRQRPLPPPFPLQSARLSLQPFSTASSVQRMPIDPRVQTLLPQKYRTQEFIALLGAPSANKCAAYYIYAARRTCPLISKHHSGPHRVCLLFTLLSWVPECVVWLRARSCTLFTFDNCARSFYFPSIRPSDRTSVWSFIPVSHSSSETMHWFGSSHENRTPDFIKSSACAFDAFYWEWSFGFLHVYNV